MQPQLRRMFLFNLQKTSQHQLLFLCCSTAGPIVGGTIGGAVFGAVLATVILVKCWAPGRKCPSCNTAVVSRQRSAQRRESGVGLLANDGDRIAQPEKNPRTTLAGFVGKRCDFFWPCSTKHQGAFPLHLSMGVSRSRRCPKPHRAPHPSEHSPDPHCRHHGGRAFSNA